MFIKTFASIERQHIFVYINVVSFKFFPYYIHDACAALACLSHKAFGTCDTTCINTNAFLIPVRDIVRFDNDAFVGKASENSRDVGLRVLKVHELGLEVSKVHEFPKVNESRCLILIYPSGVFTVRHNE